MNYTSGLTHNDNIVSGVLSGKSDIFSGQEFLSLDGVFRDNGISNAELNNLETFLKEPAVSDLEQGSHTTYNFAVEDFHTYVAGGIRVHNTSILDHVPEGSQIINVNVTEGAATETTYIRPDGVLVNISGQNINSDGTIVLSGTYEYNDGTASISYTDTYDANGELLDRDLNEIEFNNDVVQLENIGNILGSQLGSYFFDDNIVTSIAAGTLLGTITQNLGEAIQEGHFASVTQGVSSNASVNSTDGVGISLDPLNDAVTTAFKDFGVELVENLRGQVIGAASSFLLAELAEELGLEGFEAGLLTSGLGGITNVFINNVVNVTTGAQISVNGVLQDASLVDDLNFDSIAGSITNGIAGYFGSQLAGEIINPETQEEALFGSIGSATGVYIANALFAAAGPIGIFIGSFAGTLLGNLIGSAFGDEPEPPRAGGTVHLDISGQELTSSSVFAENGGSLDYAQQLVGAHVNTYNSFIENSGILNDDFSLNLGGRTVYSIDFVTGDITVLTNVIGASFQQITDMTQVFSSAEEAVEFGIVQQILQTHIVGGDALVNLVLQNTEATTLPGILFDIQTAQDYRYYLENSALINDIIATAPESVTAQRVRKIKQRIRAGDYVYVDPTDGLSKTGKLQSPALGPFRVIRKDERTYVIDRDGATERINADRVTYAPPPENAPTKDNNATTTEHLDKNTEGPTYVVDRLVTHRRTPDGTFEFLVLWYGYDEQTWEPRRNIPEELVSRYFEKRKTNDKRRRRKTTGSER